MVGDNYLKIKRDVENTALGANRALKDVTLIAVGKTKPLEMLQEAYDFGARDFGENKVQELCGKYDSMPKDIRWHLIGHLQTNKVKYAVGRAFMIHSVDSQKLAEAISKEAVKQNVSVNILIEVNVAGEDTKFGVAPADCESLIRSIADLPGINICGLMTVAPFTEDAEENRSVFIKLRELSVDIKSKNIDNVSMDCLSMGMSGDYRVAIEEGATYVRVGTSIFGERDYSIQN